MTEQNIRTRITLKPILFVVAGLVAIAGLLWLTGFFGGTFNLFVKNTGILKSRGLHDDMSQGTDTLLTQADATITGLPDILPTDPKIGPVSASLRIVVFGSMTSGYSAGAYDVINSIRADYPTVQVVWKDLFDQEDQAARDLAMAAHCANQQGKFWEFVGGVFNQSGGLPNVVVDDIAKGLGLSIDPFHNCLTNTDVTQLIDRNLTEASRLNVRSVPVWFIGSQPIDGLFPYGWFKPIIDEQLP